MKFIIVPLWTLVDDLSDHKMSHHLENIENNISEWSKLTESKDVLAVTPMKLTKGGSKQLLKEVKEVKE